MLGRATEAPHSRGSIDVSRLWFAIQFCKIATELRPNRVVVVAGAANLVKVTSRTKTATTELALVGLKQVTNARCVSF